MVFPIDIQSNEIKQLILKPSNVFPYQSALIVSSSILITNTNYFEPSQTLNRKSKTITVDFDKKTFSFLYYQRAKYIVNF